MGRPLAKYYVQECDNCGTLTDPQGAPLANQITWAVMERQPDRGGPRGGNDRCVADCDTRAEARTRARVLNLARLTVITGSSGIVVGDG